MRNTHVVRPGLGKSSGWQLWLYSASSALLLLVPTVHAGTPVQWTIASGGDGGWYEYFNTTGGADLWHAAQSEAAAQTLNVNGTLEEGVLAPVTSAAQQSWVASLATQGAGAWAIVWAGDYANNGTLYSGTQPIDPSGLRWASGRSPASSAGQSGDYGLEVFGSGYGGTVGVSSPSGDALGGYVVEFQAIPEPGTVGLAALGATAILILRRRR